jgi:hypothetical protein
MTYPGLDQYQGGRVEVDTETLLKAVFAVAQSSGNLVGSPGTPLTAERAAALLVDLTGDQSDRITWSIPAQAFDLVRGN